MKTLRQNTISDVVDRQLANEDAARRPADRRHDHHRHGAAMVAGSNRSDIEGTGGTGRGGRNGDADDGAVSAGRP
jgi:hypothetical protein